MKLEKNELVAIYGGATTAAYITAWTKVFTTIWEFGQKIGSSLRRIVNKNYC